jgi:hypothetical protein
MLVAAYVERATGEQSNTMAQPSWRIFVFALFTPDNR